MTNETKSGKKCGMCTGTKLRSTYTCPECKGLGWIPAPGDELTRNEFKTLWESGVRNIEKMSPWGNWIKITAPVLESGLKFRLAPAPQEEPMKQKSQGDLYKSFDARDWAKEFQEIVCKLYRVKLEEEWLTVWFSSALMRGWDERGRLHSTMTQQEAAVKVESVEEKISSLWGSGECFRCEDKFSFKKGARAIATWILSLTSAQLDALRNERNVCP